MKLKILLLICLLTLICIKAKPVERFAIIGDWGSINASKDSAELELGAQKVLDEVAKFHSKDKVDTVISVGDADYLDMAYAFGNNRLVNAKNEKGEKLTIDDNKAKLKDQTDGIMDDLANRLKKDMFVDEKNRNFWNVLGNHDCNVSYAEDFFNWKPKDPTLKYAIERDVIMTKEISLDKGKKIIIHFLNFCKLSLLNSGLRKFKVGEVEKSILDLYTESNFPNWHWRKLDMSKDDNSVVEHFSLTESSVINAAQSYLLLVEIALQKAKKDINLQWHMVVMHNTFFSEGGEHGDSIQIKKFLLPLFQKYNVDLVFNGHEHISQFSTIEKSEKLDLTKARKPRSTSAIFWGDAEKLSEKIKDDKIKQKAVDIIKTSKEYGNFGETEIEPKNRDNPKLNPCQNLYQTEEAKDSVEIDATKTLSNVLMGNTEGRGVSYIGREKAAQGTCDGDKITGKGQLSQGKVRYVNSKFYGWASMEVTVDKCVIKYHHITKPLDPKNPHDPKDVNAFKLASKVFTVTLNKKSKRKFMK